MRQSAPPHDKLRRPFGALAAVVLVSLPIDRAGGATLLGLYPGETTSRAQVQAHARAPSLDFAANPAFQDAFKQNHLLFMKVRAGLRPNLLVGAELDHIDLARPSDRAGAFPADVSMKGPAAFGLLYLPLPSPALDVYARAGVARLKSTVNAVAEVAGAGACSGKYPPCNLRPLALDRTDTGFAAGAGARLKLGSWALRLECERFIAAGGHPGFVSVGFTWTFP